MVKTKAVHTNRQLFTILFHIALGVIASIFRDLMTLYFLLVVGYFLYRIFSKPNKEIEVMRAAAYIMGAEVFFRMTKALFFYESGKYVVILFLAIGIFYRGFKKRAFAYIVYMLLLIPGVYVAFLNLDFDAEFRRMIMFNLSGPICLAVSAIYCYGKSFHITKVLHILDMMVYPLISMTVYVFLYAPDLREVITSTVSNSAASGGYGPNQVATVLGLGVFILYNRLLMPYKNKLVHLIMMFLLVAMAYRALVTFSRGGVIVAFLMIGSYTFIYYTIANLKGKFKLTYKVIAIVGAGLAIWAYAVLQTGGLIGNRYANQDALGREKEDVTTGRVDLIQADFEAFMEEPFLGIGVGRVKSFYIERLNVDLPSHNEIARMLSEHGALGIMALCILIFAPLTTKIQGRKNSFFIPFIIFSFFTMAHSSMRIAAPAFIYGMALISISYASKKGTVHRK